MSRAAPYAALPATAVSTSRVYAWTEQKNPRFRVHLVLGAKETKRLS